MQSKITGHDKLKKWYVIGISVISMTDRELFQNM